MSSKSVIILSLAVTLSAASPVFADYEYDGSGAPINMHLVQPPTEPSDALASTRAQARRAATPVSPFTDAEKRLFKRAVSQGAN